ncbi:MAG: EscI/YscI/HrpB family type III secretion system inner rod protein [Gammaproteobacteria bacterium]
MAIELPMVLAQATLAPPGATAATAAATPVAGPGEAARFRSLMGSQPVQSDAVVSTTVAAPVAPPMAAGEGGNVGDAILRGLEKVRGSVDGALAAATSRLDPQGGPVSTQRMLEFQLDILHLGFTHQMLGSVVAKTAQDIDQLVKMQ